MVESSYRNLNVWKKSIDLVLLIYRLTKPFPRDEVYGLTAQLRRASVSVPSNIAEGQGRKANNDFRRFLHLAMGSLMEVETQVIIAAQLGYIDGAALARVENDTREIGRMLNGLMANLPEPRPRATMEIASD